MINPAQPHFKDAKRIVVKIGSALVVDNATAAPRAAWLASVAADIAALRARGAEVEGAALRAGLRLDREVFAPARARKSKPTTTRKRRE